MVIYTPGVHRIDAATYHADTLRPEPTLSSGLARVLLNRSPLHAWTQHPRLNPAYEPTESATFDIGRAAHRAVLGVGEGYVAIPQELLSDDGGVRSKDAKAWVADARASGLTPIKADVVDRIGAIQMTTGDKLAQMGITLDPTRSELTALAEVEGVWCRAMIDNAPADPRQPLRDFKTCEDASPEAVIKHVCNYGYDVQAAWYLDTWKAATGESRRFQFVFTEKAAPHSVCVVELHDAANDSADWMEDARGKCAEARRMWRECLAADRWPDYPARVAVIGAPSWHRQKWADRPTPAPISAATVTRVTAWQAPKG